jgi:Fe-S cluster assembly ATPase SufC
MEKVESKIAKFTGSVELEKAMDRMMATVNDGFSGGRVSRHDLVSWVVLYFEKSCFQECVDNIRQDHFDQVAYLESVLKQAKQARKAGTDVPDISSLLAPLVGQSKAAPVKRNKKSDQPELLSA